MKDERETKTDNEKMANLLNKVGQFIFKTLFKYFLTFLLGESPSSIGDNVTGGGGGGGSFLDLAIRAQIELRNVKVKVTLR